MNNKTLGSLLGQLVAQQDKSLKAGDIYSNPDLIDQLANPQGYPTPKPSPSPAPVKGSWWERLLGLV
jgi:hypothetical protein